MMMMLLMVVVFYFSRYFMNIDEGDVEYDEKVEGRR